MFDNGMTGAVGFAMHEDRLAKAADGLRIAEAQQGRRAAGIERTVARFSARRGSGTGWWCARSPACRSVSGATRGRSDSPV